MKYSVDLLSPAELTLLRRAVIVHEDDAEPEVAVVGWELTELPG
jgi:hypothetical protein